MPLLTRLFPHSEGRDYSFCLSHWVTIISIICPHQDSANKYGIRDNTLGQDAERDVFPLLNITLYMLHFNI